MNEQHDPLPSQSPTTALIASNRPPAPTAPRGRRLRRALAAAQARFVRARAGSVLILVVALLVLIALAGTALIITARTDRYATGQNTANTQIDLLVEAVVRLTKGALVDDLFGNNQYRPRAAQPTIPWTATPPGEFENYDSPRNDSWMASRVPNGPAANPYWLYVSAPMVSGQWFESPAGGTYGYRTRMEPTFLRVGGETHPAFKTYTNPYGGGTATGPYLAADADGDGIADAGLWRVPVGQLNGVTYYAAVRIIDNSAAFNANVHWTANRDAVTAPSPQGDLFANNIDFDKALYQYGTGTADEFGQTPAWGALPSGFYAAYTREAQMYDLSRFRAGDPAHVPGVAPATPPGNNLGLVSPPVDDTGATVNAFEWVSPYDQWHHQLGRRLDNPGFYAAGQKFRALSAEDATSIAYRFTLRNPNSLVASPIEQMLLPSLEFPIDASRTATSARTPRTRTQPYPAPYVTGIGSVPTWFAQNFDFMNASRIWSRRSVTVTRNPTNSAAPLHDMTALAARTPGVIGTTVSRMPAPGGAAGQVPMRKASVNTANFGELWRAFWMVMETGGEAAVDANGDTVPDLARAIFRTPFHGPTLVPDPVATGTGIGPRDMVLVRAAQAAVNVEDLRDSDTYTGGALPGPFNQNVTSHRVRVRGVYNGAETPVEVTVFGNEAQPFITEVYANNDSAKRMNPAFQAGDDPATQFIRNPKGYFAVELFNPTNVTINLRGWRVGVIYRQTPAVAPATNYPDMLVFPLNGGEPLEERTLAPGKFLVLENYNNGATGDDAASFRPNVVGAFVDRIFVKELHKVLDGGGGELVLLRPRRGDGRPSTVGGDDGYEEINAATDKVNYDELVPLDSFDFSGLETPPAFPLPADDGSAQFREVHYVRQTPREGEVGDLALTWKCVYPGQWAPGPKWREEGMAYSANLYAADVTNFDTPWFTAGLKDEAGVDIKIALPDDRASYPNVYPGIQLNNKDFAGVNQLTATANHFPFGTFARNGDILQTPFIGAYTVRTQANADLPHGGSAGRSLILEMNAITRDAAVAHDHDPANPATPVNTFDDEYEMIGRFCPLATVSPRWNPAFAVIPPNADPYAWAQDVFDYLTVDAPQPDYLPNVKPEVYGTWTSDADAAGANIHPIATPHEELEENNSPPSVDGKINLNTAPARVIASLRIWPLTKDDGVLPGSIANNGVDDNNEVIANMIVRWRDGDPAAGILPQGPIYSLMDLNRVVDPLDTTKRFQSAANAVSVVDDAGYQPGPPEGDLSSDGTALGDRVTNDFEGRYLVMNRVSNQLSTRSDSYTVYIIVQGWRGVGTANPTLVVQRRAAFLADRSGIDENHREVGSVVVPTN
jgi:hypothetical protein